MKRRTNGWDIARTFFLLLLCIIMFYPIWYVIAASLMPGAEYLSTRVVLFPKHPTLDNYRFMLINTGIFKYVLNTLLITVVGTVAGLLLTAYTAYGLSRRFPGVRVLVFLVVATMFLDPGIIPVYINFKNLHILDTRLALISTLLITPFYLIIMRSQFQVFPEELIDAAKVDGYSESRIFFTIIMPLSKAMLAAIGLFLAVSYWNLYLPSVFFVTSQEKKTIQDFLAAVLSSGEMPAQAAQKLNAPPVAVLRMAMITAGAFPIVVVYPFLQKYFIQGGLMGALKE